MKSKDFWSSILIVLTIFAIGLSKKVLLADAVAPIATAAFTSASSGTLDAAHAWLGTLAYTVQLYFDFSGYTDMAIGAALLFGVRLPVNFASPYKASSLIDFWRRWHITLSRWIRDYIYIPLGGNRGGAMRAGRNILITMGLAGLWHGANWTFVAWGLVHALAIIWSHARGRGANRRRHAGSMEVRRSPDSGRAPFTKSRAVCGRLPSSWSSASSSSPEPVATNRACGSTCRVPGAGCSGGAKVPWVPGCQSALRLRMRRLPRQRAWASGQGCRPRIWL